MPSRQISKRRFAALARHIGIALIVVVAASSTTLALAPGVQAATASQHGLLPPANPAKSMAPSPNFLGSSYCGTSPNTTEACNNQIIEAIDNARSTLEKLGGFPSNFSLKGFDSLTSNEQLLVITNLERTGRGLNPVDAITNQLDSMAAKGAADNADPVVAPFPLHLSGGGVVQAYWSNWAGGLYNPLGSDYMWMYDDGPGSPNGDCTTKTPSGCWGHRDNILASIENAKYCPSGSKMNILMGAANVTNASYSPSIAQLIVLDCGALPPTQYGYGFSWAAAMKVVFPPAPS